MKATYLCFTDQVHSIHSYISYPLSIYALSTHAYTGQWLSINLFHICTSVHALSLYACSFQNKIYVLIAALYDCCPMLLSFTCSNKERVLSNFPYLCFTSCSISYISVHKLAIYGCTQLIAYDFCPIWFPSCYVCLSIPKGTVVALFLWSSPVHKQAVQPSSISLHSHCLSRTTTLYASAI